VAGDESHVVCSNGDANAFIESKVFVEPGTVDPLLTYTHKMDADPASMMRLLRPSPGSCIEVQKL